MFKKAISITTASALALTSLTFSPTPAHAITVGALSTQSATGGNASCTGTTITVDTPITYTTADAAPASQPTVDRFVVRMLDADNNTIAAGGMQIQAGQSISFAPQLVVGQGTINGISAGYTISTPTRRPFRFEVYESTTGGIGVSTYSPTGAALAVSPTFDPATGTGFFTAGCSSLPGGAGPSDTTAPTVNVPANIAVNTDSGLTTAVVNYTVTATDDVGVTSGPTRTAGLASGAAFPLGVTTVTHTASDAAGNVGTGSFTVTVTDAENPVVTVPANIAVNTDSGLATAVVAYSVSATDNVGVTSGPTRTVGLASGAAFPIGVTTVTHTAGDAAGNTGSDSFTVTVTDAEDPAITVPADITVNTDPGLATAVVNYAVTATDNSGPVTPVLVSGPASGSAFPVGTTTVTWSVTDPSGNSVNDSFDVTVQDNENPVVTVPANIAVNTDPGQATAVVAFAASVTDAVDGAIAPQVTSSPTAGLVSGSAFPIGTTTVTVSGTDNAGNTGTGSFTVTVTDAEDPAITVPADITVNTDPGLATAVVNYAVTATDNSGPVTPALVSGPASGSAFPVGTTTVTWSVTDPFGNSVSDSFDVTVQDNENPVVTVPANIAVNTDPGQATAVVAFAASVTDAVDGAIAPQVTSSPTAGLVSGSAFPIGTTTVTVSGTDNAGNTGSDSFTVTVTDNQAPVFTSTQPDINVEIDFNLTTAIVTFPTPTASDNSGSVTVLQTQGLASGAAFPLGTTLVEFTATDPTGLTATLQFNVTVSLIPPGTVTFVVNSPDDGTVAFASATPAFNTAVVVTGGTGSSGPIQVVPGAYTATYTLPAGFAVTAATCSAASGSVSIGTQTVSMTFARGETYTCTLTSRDIAAQTGQQIQSFMDNRGRQIMSNQPGRGRRIARTNGDSNPNTVTMFGNRMNTGILPLGIAVSQDRVELSFASSSASLDPLSARSDWDFWFEASLSRYETGYGEGRFGILHAGADYRIAENAILGFGVQIDFANEDVNGTTATTDGVGWMVGPYYTARIGEALYFDASLRYGRSDNEISPLGTYTDEFSTERWLATIGLFGSIDRDMLTIQPGIAINYFEETSEAYIDSLAVPIASRTTRLGEVEVGSRFIWADPMGGYTTFIEIDGIYTFEANGEVAAQSTVETGLRGRVGFGGTVATGDTGTFDYSIRYDGLGDDDYEAISVSLGFSMSF